MTLPHRDGTSPARASDDVGLVPREPAPRGAAPHDAAFERLVREHYAGLCTFTCRFVGCPAVAEDLVLELFAHLWDVRGRSVPAVIDRGYLYRAARNRALDYLRRRRVASAWIGRMTAEVDRAGERPDDRLDEREQAAAAARVVAALPAQRRRIFEMCRWDGMSYAEVAARLGISVRTVNTQMTRALQRLRAELAPCFALLAPLVAGVAAARSLLG
ncbi:MAG: RNA polymerase sigma-70 factor [Gemmatimonadaceae bacterium]|nr:RNA polymerase sigma-70 factor [Gemmatimonadaceae bacterium]